MFRRFVSLITLISIFTLLPNEIAWRVTASPTPTSIPDKARKTPCAPCSAGAQSDGPFDQLDRLATLGRSTQSFPFAPLTRSVFEGATVNQVSTATGQLAFSVTDLSLPGTMPVKFQRIYASDRNGESGLGVGWSFSFDDRLIVDGRTATLTTGTGSLFNFRREGDSRRFVLKADEPHPNRSFSMTDSNVIIEEAGAMTRSYKKLGQTYRLSQIADPNGNRITISFDERGNIARIANDSGGALILKWSAGEEARLLNIADTAGQQVSYQQDGQRLRSVTDVAGARLTYDYQAGRLTRLEDPAGRTLLRVRYDKAGRVAEAGDALGAYLYQYDTTSGIARRTIVVDPTGVKTSYEQTERGLLTAIDAGEGEIARIEYDAASRPVLISNSSGDETRFTYDAQHRLLRQSSTSGQEVAYTYDEEGRVSSSTSAGERTEYTRDARGNIIAARSSDPAKSYSVTLNARGQTISVKSGSGRESTSEYDSSGNETAFAFSDVGRFQKERNAAGRITSELLPSGLRQNYEYDSRGRVIKQTDSRGRALTFERDASGALTGIMTAKGVWLRAARDEVGRIVTLTNSAGKSRRFAYNASGALTAYTDARGQQKKLGYDRRGRVRDITNSNGDKTIIERDRQGRPHRISFSDGTRWRYDYDRAGKLVNVKREETHRDNAARALTASLNHPAATSSTASATLPIAECFFTYDAFYNSWDWDGLSGMSDSGLFGFGSLNYGFYSGYGCADPFEGLSAECAGYDEWFYDSWMGSDCGAFGGESYQECVARQRRICQNKRTSCGVSAAGIFGAAMAGCYVVLLVNPIAGAICATGAFIKYLADLSACDIADQNCRLEIPDKCRT